jgi:hypothetical protein
MKKYPVGGVIPCGLADRWIDSEADMTKLIVAFHNLANMKKN